MYLVKKMWYRKSFDEGEERWQLIYMILNNGRREHLA